MKKNIFKPVLTTLLLLGMVNLQAQDYKVSVAGEKIKLVINEVNKVEIEGISGTEIIFSTTSRSRSSNERAQGLKAISSLGLEDNSGIGLSVEEKGDKIEVNQISRRSNSRYIIQVPKNVSVTYRHSTHWGSKLSVRNVESEIEISTNHSSVNLENVTGPMTINTVHGKIEAVFSELNQTAPTSIVSVHGLVDITLPANTKADLRLDTNWGEIFTDMNIEIDRTASDLRKISSQTIKGKLNGGGVSFNLSSTHNNIYLRKK